jgi:hypothetical protein
MPSNPNLQACRKTVAPSSSVCSLKTIPAGFRANSLARFALRALQEVECVQDRLCGLAAAVQGIEDGDAVDTNYYRLAVHGE